MASKKSSAKKTSKKSAKKTTKKSAKTVKKAPKKTTKKAAVKTVTVQPVADSTATVTVRSVDDPGEVTEGQAAVVKPYFDPETGTIVMRPVTN